MPKFEVYGIGGFSVYLGEYKAETEKEAKEKCFNDPNANIYPSLCHECSKEIEIGDIVEYQTDLKDE